MPDQRRTPVRPLDPPMVPLTLAGTGVWGVVGLASLVTDPLASWRWTCLAGFLFGLGLLGLMLLRDARRSRGKGHLDGDRAGGATP